MRIHGVRYTFYLSHPVNKKLVPCVMCEEPIQPLAGVKIDDRYRWRRGFAHFRHLSELIIETPREFTNPLPGVYNEAEYAPDMKVPRGELINRVKQEYSALVEEARHEHQKTARAVVVMGGKSDDGD